MEILSEHSLNSWFQFLECDAFFAFEKHCTNLVQTTEHLDKATVFERKLKSGGWFLRESKMLLVGGHRVDELWRRTIFWRTEHQTFSNFSALRWHQLILPRGWRKYLRWSLKLFRRTTKTKRIYHTLFYFNLVIELFWYNWMNDLVLRFVCYESTLWFSSHLFALCSLGFCFCMEVKNS